MSQSDTSDGQSSSTARYAAFGALFVVALFGAWYFTSAFLIAPTIDGPAADQVQGLPATNVDELSIGGERLVPNAAEEVAE
ncbi:hypothetical protein [Jannaschia aquimarina]|uniref:Uncharacterized protein n=1 Tax=Jannaschia aquimarina TaxID=935700 RepID=A0A0D1EES7_9RHOB|nr:hypothetical protein [Jannaschia aquimarina]KIT15386.1 hypothetical protein jaqu_28190 [Jannaschia aquimarina]SNT23056.1 hypothetical protein SAMN05421775_10895 [Jannaschia aquimarina]